MFNLERKDCTTVRSLLGSRPGHVKGEIVTGIGADLNIYLDEAGTLSVRISAEPSHVRLQPLRPS